MLDECVSNRMRNSERMEQLHKCETFILKWQPFLTPTESVFSVSVCVFEIYMQREKPFCKSHFVCFCALSSQIEPRTIFQTGGTQHCKLKIENIVCGNTQHSHYKLHTNEMDLCLRSRQAICSAVSLDP